jgi:osmotically-inducible protein OsmY
MGEGHADQPRGGKMKKIVIAAVIFVLLILAGATCYLYFAGYIGDRPDKIAMQINSDLEKKDIDLRCEIDKDWIATLKGSVRNVTDENVAKDIVYSHKQIKELKWDTQVQPSPSEIKTAIDSALMASGIKGINVDVDNNFTATLTGIITNESERENAIRIATGQGKAKNVKDNLQIQTQQLATSEAAPAAPAPSSSPPVEIQEKPSPKVEKRHRIIIKPIVKDPAKIEGDINRALRNAGMDGITAEVSDNFSVILKGSIGNEEDKNRAIQIAKSFNGIRNVRDRIFVVRID